MNESSKQPEKNVESAAKKRVEWYDQFQQKQDPPSADRERVARWSTFGIFLAFSALEIYLVTAEWFTLATHKEWIIAIGAVVFPVLAAASGLELLDENSRLRKVLKWVLLAPFILLAIAIAGGFSIWGAVSIGGWFADIPSWAAVIIVLLALLLMKK